MKVVILAGGYGTRIRDVQDDIPKPMIPVGPYPILLHIMRRYARYGFKEFVICLGYKDHVIKDFFLTLSLFERYDSRPPSETAAKSDFGTTLSISWSF